MSGINVACGALPTPNVLGTTAGNAKMARPEARMVHTQNKLRFDLLCGENP
jgi:hypothetical protein